METVDPLISRLFNKNGQKFSTSKFLLWAHGMLVPEQRCASELLSWKYCVDRKQLVDLVRKKYSFLCKYSPVSTVITDISVDDLVP